MSYRDQQQLKLLLHKRLIEGDLTVSAEIAEFFLPKLTDYLQRCFPNLPDSHWIDIAVTDALMNYLRRLEQFNSRRASLMYYLKLSYWDAL